MRYALLVCGPAYGTEQSVSAWQFAEALTESQHQLTDIFFYQDGVYNASSLVLPANDEVNLVKKWVTLAAQHHIALHICSSAAMRRGMVDSAVASQNQWTNSNIDPAFQLSGLTQLATLMLQCDRVIQF